MNDERGKKLFLVSRDITDIFNIKKIYQGKCLETEVSQLL